jgi:hypothetical protein
MIEQTRKRQISVLLAVFFAVIACSMANYGSLESNPGVTQEFKAYQVLPGCKYYYRGSFSRPIAIVGINSKYRLESRLWVPIDPAAKKFRVLINKISLQANGPVEPWGFVIRDAAGKRIGVWYSAIRGATIKVDENGLITRLLPQPRAALGRQPK